MRCFVGSFNLDPRSAALNTEMGAFVQHPALARQVAAEHARLSDPRFSWRLVLEDGRLTWCDRWEEKPRSIDREPVASFWRRLIAGAARRLPIEEQL
jgi:putative cardiolipin synthase